MSHHAPDEQTWDTLELERIIVNDEPLYLWLQEMGEQSANWYQSTLEYLCGENDLTITEINWSYMAQELRDL